MTLGLLEIVIIVAAIIVFFLIPKQLPKFGKAIGDTIRELRGVKKELQKGGRNE